MTKSQFKKSMLRGQGRCIQWVENEPNLYAPVVLWACGNTIAYDAQCEGTRAWFVYQLISRFHDKAPFIEALISNLKKARSKGGWKVLYLSEILGYFAKDGINEAEQALWDKYCLLYSILLNRKRPIKSFFHERDDYEMLCLVLATNKNSFMKIAEDIGRLYKKATIYDGGDFHWLHSGVGVKYLCALKMEGKNSDNIARYLNVKSDYDKTSREGQKNYSQPLPKSGVTLSLWLKNKADKATVQNYVCQYLEESDIESRTQALSAFVCCPYPSDPTPVIADALSPYEPLKDVAWQVLGNIRHPMVREVALEHFQSDLERGLPIFIKNYQNTDAGLIEKLVKSIPVDFKDSSPWHGVHLDVIRLYDEGVKVPTCLLLFILDVTYCSQCREHVIKQLGKRKGLTNNILQESLFDSNENIRKYAKNRVNK